jgi:hypothetical protein
MSTQNTAQAWAFLIEIYKRFSSKSPRFFVVMQWVSMIAFVVTGLPGVLQEMGVVLPGAWAEVQSKVIGWASAIAYFISKMPVADPSGLPFTEKK